MSNSIDLLEQCLKLPAYKNDAMERIEADRSLGETAIEEAAALLCGTSQRFTWTPDEQRQRVRTHLASCGIDLPETAYDL